MTILDKCYNPELGLLAQEINKHTVSDMKFDKKEFENNPILVILDPGHYESELGKRSPDGRLREYAYTRRVVKALAEKFGELGIKHAYSCDIEKDNTYLQDRPKVVNKLYDENDKKAILVSVHNDAAGNGSTWANARGWSVFVDTIGSKNSKKLATYISEAAKELGLKVRKELPDVNYWTKNLYILKHTKCPAVLTENLFQDNKEDVEFLLSDEGFKTIVNLHLIGICKYLKEAAN